MSEPHAVNLSFSVSHEATRLHVDDLSGLYRAALSVARRQGLTRYVWRQMRTDARHASPVHADLHLLLSDSVGGDS